MDPLNYHWIIRKDSCRMDTSNCLGFWGKKETELKLLWRINNNKKGDYFDEMGYKHSSCNNQMEILLQQGNQDILQR
ncbi:hypothetical protein Anas_06799 [Armadillidium nasatum]|uniref:Uncharacterized protein n=1 Tax=Armadillidium nasatum TaxID=96803 RepID=A0A5N5SUZ1_9CRUS|nr:hypothetical protein Anas_06799 [Armadillidium nasatum]